VSRCATIVTHPQGRPQQARDQIGSTFAGPHSVACAEISGMHQVMIVIVDVQVRGPKGRNNQ